MTPARHLLALAEEELALVLGRRIDDLPDLHGRREGVVERLPERLTDDDVVALRRAAQTQDRVTTALADLLAETRTELGLLATGRRAARGYTPAGLEPTSALELTA